MATSISGQNWTQGSDKFGFIDPNGPLVQSSGFADFLAGNDSLSGSFAFDPGIEVYGGSSVFASGGADTISGDSEDADGILVYGSSLISMGDGNDAILGSSIGADGIFIQEGSTLSGGKGNDLIGGDSYEGDGFHAIDSVVDLGAGNDYLYGESYLSDGLIAENSYISAGDGNDTIGGYTAFGTAGLLMGEDSLLDTGKGNDVVEGYGTTFGISVNFSTVALGAGNDEVHGYGDATGFDETVNSTGIALFDFADLYGDAGNDCVSGIAFVDASGNDCQANAVGVDAFGESLIDLGSGNDTLFGEAVASTDFPGSSNPTTSATGIRVAFNSELLAGTGNDAITANAFAIGEDSTSIGIHVSEGSLLDTGTGNDCIAAYAQADNNDPSFGYADATGIAVEFDSQLDLNTGNDTLFGEAEAFNFASQDSADAVGIYVGDSSNLYGGSGKNSVEGRAKAESDNELHAAGIQVGNSDPSDDSTLELGGGNDSLFGYAEGVSSGGTGEVSGIENLGATIDLGAGNDNVLGQSVDGEGDSLYSAGIYNALNSDNSDFGKILLGDGNDTLTGIGEDVGIYNDGTIDAGRGNDLIDGSQGGFDTNEETSAYFMGAGKDIVKGFGYGNFYGGDGTDTLRLFGTAGGVQYEWDGTNLTSSDTDFHVEDFEKIAAYAGGSINFGAEGTYTVYTNKVVFTA